MKIVICEPGKPARTQRVMQAPELQELQEMVGGYIEVVRPDGMPKGVVLVCNEEGKLRPDMKANRWVSLHGTEDVIFGTFVLLGSQGDELVPLDETTAEKVKQVLETPAASSTTPQSDAEGRQPAEAAGKPKSMTQQLEDVAAQICAKICKWMVTAQDEDDLERHCRTCPLNRLV